MVKITFNLIFLLVVYSMQVFGQSKMKVVEYDANLKFYIGKGGNSVVLTNHENNEALIIDTKQFIGAKQLRKYVSSPKVTIINTHFHMDHTRGNKMFPDAYVISGDCNWKLWKLDSGGSKKPDKIILPDEIYELAFNDEIVRIFNMGNCHTYSDCIVYFVNRKILIAGDLVWNKAHPMVLDSKCSILNWIKALNTIGNIFDLETVVPGHGEIGGKELISDMESYFTSIMKTIDHKKELKRVKQTYTKYDRFPFVCNFSNTVRKIKREIRNRKTKLLTALT